MGMILGAGFTGLAAGMKTGYPIFEAKGEAGGICRSYNRGGFEFSVGGGHWIFGDGAGLDFIKGQAPLSSYNRRASIYYNTAFPYPFQSTAGAELDVRKDGSLKHWLLENFGKEQCNMFFFPFNEKYTAGLYEKVVQTDAYKSPKVGGKGFCSHFYDPVDGLTALIDKMASQCQIYYKEEADRIDVKEKIIYFTSGHYQKYDEIISTMPLNRLMRICGKESDLPYTSIFCVNIGAEKGKCTPTDHWTYVPFCNAGFFRVGFYSNVNPEYAAPGYISLSVEISVLPKHRPGPLETEQIIYDVVEELQKWGWIGAVKVIDPTWVDCAYTWLYQEDDAKEDIEWLAKKGIYSTGRYGSWKFCGMKESVEMGLAMGGCSV